MKTLQLSIFAGASFLITTISVQAMEPDIIRCPTTVEFKQSKDRWIPGGTYANFPPFITRESTHHDPIPIITGVHPEIDENSIQAWRPIFDKTNGNFLLRCGYTLKNEEYKKDVFYIVSTVSGYKKCTHFLKEGYFSCER